MTLPFDPTIERLSANSRPDGDHQQRTLAEVLGAPDELTCRRLLALLRPGDRRSDVQAGGPDVIS